MVGRNVATVSKRSLYPIERDELTAKLVEEVVGFRHSNGQYDLRRSLTPPERVLLDRRRSLIVDNLAPARGGDYVDDILEMLMGFGGGSQGIEAAQAIAAQYVSTLSGLPAWAVKRSCQRWARGEVRADEVGEKTLSRTFAPSAAHVRMIAEEIVKPHAQEAARLAKTLAAQAEPLKEEDRVKTAPKIRAMADETIRKLGSPSLEDLDRTREADTRHRVAALAFNRKAILAGYDLAGVEPPDGILCSLDTLLTLGWRIEEVSVNKRVERQLLPPPKAPPRRSREDYEQST